MTKVKYALHISSISMVCSSVWCEIEGNIFSFFFQMKGVILKIELWALNRYIWSFISITLKRHTWYIYLSICKCEDIASHHFLIRNCLIMCFWILGFWIDKEKEKLLKLATSPIYVYFIIQKAPFLRLFSNMFGFDTTSKE